jgi:hypothetical protein
MRWGLIFSFSVKDAKAEDRREDEAAIRDRHEGLLPLRLNQAWELARSRDPGAAGNNELERSISSCEAFSAPSNGLPGRM